MAKENKKSLIIWATVALVVGVILGLLITNITTTGQAKSALGLDTERQEANLQEARLNLYLQNLNVSNILANTAYDSQINVSSYLKANSGFYANEALIGNNGLQTTYLRTNNISKIEQDTGSIVVEDKMVFYDGLEVFNSPLMAGRYNQSTAFIVYPDQDPTGDGTSTIAIKAPITIDAPTKFAELENTTAEASALYSVGNNFMVGSYLIEVIDILDANNTVILKFTKDGQVSTYYSEEGDIILGLIEVGSMQENLVQLTIIPSGNAYACLDEFGNLFRSDTPCN